MAVMWSGRTRAATLDEAGEKNDERKSGLRGSPRWQHARIASQRDGANNSRGDEWGGADGALEFGLRHHGDRQQHIETGAQGVSRLGTSAWPRCGKYASYPEVDASVFRKLH